MTQASIIGNVQKLVGFFFPVNFSQFEQLVFGGNLSLLGLQIQFNNVTVFVVDVGLYPWSSASCDLFLINLK